ncbi:MAG: hypothetical protein RL199_1291 [Pseudomonadota bacterium]|jgi:puromycin-sensitive aminopeptidase
MGDRHFRLPTWIRPERYDFVIAPDIAARRFEGHGTVALVSDRATTAVVLHGVALEVHSASVGSNVAAVTADADSQTLTLRFDDALPAGRHLLALDWAGRFHEDLRGFYVAGEVGVTQFEAADARRTFPCFDEPAFKTSWKLAIEAGGKLELISNGAQERVDELPGGRRRVHFAETPRMSSYLVAMVVGDLRGSAPKVARDVAIRTWAVPGKEQLTDFGQECAAAVLPLLEDYFDHTYVFGKLDQLGIPDFEAGAMENSGCVTFREVLLLVDPAKAPLSVKKRAAEVITHELAHQWFGNLVTMQWWDDLWLNEAFATWMAYKVVDQWRPDWRMWDDFESGKHAALQLDAMASTHPIRGEVKCAEEATENFDLITYEKGGAMLRMLEGFLGADSFRQGIRAYMKRFAFQNAAADDLWGALAEASGQPIREVANEWIGKGGYPLVTAAVSGAGVHLSQQRFFADPAAFAAGSDDHWLVPLVLKWADDAGVHETRHLLRTKAETVALPAKGAVRWVYANAGGAGFYRVRYGGDGLSGLLEHAEALTPVEKINLVADAWALYRADAAPLDGVMDLLVRFAADDDYAVVTDAAGRLDGIERRFVPDADIAAFRAVVSKAFERQLDRTGWDVKAGESDDAKLLRAAAVKALASVAREPAAVREAVSRLARSEVGDAAALDPNLLDAAALASARAGDEAVFEGWARKATTETDPAAKRRALVALASFEAPGLVAKAHALFATDVVPKQDATTFLGTLLASRAGKAATWAWVQANWSLVREKTSAPMLTRRLVESLGELFDQRSAVEAQFAAHATDLAASPAAVQQTTERMRLDEAVARRARPDLSRWLAARG